MLLLAAALAAPPLDADGAYLHVATVPVHSLRSPSPIQRSMSVLAWSADADAVWIVHGTGELARITREGVLERDAWQHVQLGTMGVSGHFVAEGGALTYYEMPFGVKRADLVSGAITPALGPVDPPTPSGVYHLPDGTWWLASSQRDRVRRFDGREWGPPEAADTLRRGEFGAGEKRAVPCGTDEKGTPVVSWIDIEARTVTLSTVTPDLRVGEALWSRPMEFDVWSGRRYDEPRACAKRGDLVLLGLDRELLVFEGDALIAAIRGGATEKAYPRDGTGPYAPQNLDGSALLGQDLLVGLERGAELRLYARRSTVPLAKAKAGGDWLGVLRAGAKGADRFDALWALGWWELLETEARAAGDEAWRSRARARQIVHWALGGPAGKTYLAPGRVEQLDETYLSEVEADLRARPDSPWLLYAQALLLERMGREAQAHAALASLQQALPGDGLTAADVTQLFALAAARGDLDAMKRMHDGVDARRAPRTHALWAAHIARVEQKPLDAVAVLKALGEDRDALVLTARSLADAGELDRAIATWLKVRALAPDDAVVHGGLGAAYLRRGLVELAVESLTEAVNRDPGTPAYRSNLAAAYAAQDQKNDALKQLYGALGDRPDDVLLQHQLQAAMGGAAAGTGGEVAVLPFDVAGGAVERVGMGEMLASMASTALVNGGVGVVERARIDAVLAEQSLQRTSHVDPATAVQMGKVVGATSLITGTVAEFEGRLVFDVRRVDVKSGKVVQAAHADAPLELEPLQQALEAAVKRVRP